MNRNVPIGQFREALTPMIAGDFEEEHRTMLEGEVWRDGHCIFQGLSMNDVVVNRGATAGMVELRVDIGQEFMANIRADGLIPTTRELELVDGGTTYVCQRAEGLGGGGARVYFVVKGDWAHVRHLTAL